MYLPVGIIAKFNRGFAISNSFHYSVDEVVEEIAYYFLGLMIILALFSGF